MLRHSNENLCSKVLEKEFFLVALTPDDPYLSAFLFHLTYWSKLQPASRCSKLLLLLELDGRRKRKERKMITASTWAASVSIRFTPFYRYQGWTRFRLPPASDCSASHSVTVLIASRLLLMLKNLSSRFLSYFLSAVPALRRVVTIPCVCARVTVSILTPCVRSMCTIRLISPVKSSSL